MTITSTVLRATARRLFMGAALALLVAAPAQAAQSGKATQDINLRQEPKLDSAVVAWVKAGETVEILAQSGAFSRVRNARGGEGYLKTKYLEPATAAPATTPPAVTPAPPPKKAETKPAESPAPPKPTVAAAPVKPAPAKPAPVAVKPAESSAPTAARPTANFGVVSEYLFRGIEQSGGAAVQGGIDWASSRGLYLGAWTSNTGGSAASGGTELDLYGGWAGAVGPVGLDLGLIYYYYPEDEEDLGLSFDYPEIYAKFALSYFALQVYYSSDYLGDANEALANTFGRDTDFLYLNLLGTFPLSDTLSATLQFGDSTGDGAEVAWCGTLCDGYNDYSVSLTKTLGGGLSWSLGLYDTDMVLGEAAGTLPADDDGPKVVGGIKRTFGL